jgi:hypothetical protein
MCAAADAFQYLSPDQHASGISHTSKPIVNPALTVQILP